MKVPASLEAGSLPDYDKRHRNGVGVETRGPEGLFVVFTVRPGGDPERVGPCHTVMHGPAAGMLDRHEDPSRCRGRLAAPKKRPLSTGDTAGISVNAWD